MAHKFRKLSLLSDANSEISKELGDLGRHEIEELFRRLTGHGIQPGDRFLYRSCPSLIIRGEAQLLGLSDPRFGFRLTMRENGTKTIALINLRRIARVLDQFAGIRTDKSFLQCQLRSLDSEELLQVKTACRPSAYKRLCGPLDYRSMSSMADCLIPTPESFADRKRWCIAHLPGIVTQHYGEEFSLETVPFIRPLQFISGGHCAQACCWMGDHYGYVFGLSHSVHALHDITWFARPDGEKVMNITGLSVMEMIRYYNTSRLRGTQSQLRLSHQFLDDENLSAGVSILSEPHYRPAGRAIKSYIRSGLPVFVRVDADRMQGRGTVTLPMFENIYNRSRLMMDRPQPKQRKAVHDVMHMIMIMGYDRNGTDVVFNDPSRGPYLIASLGQLFTAGCYLRPAAKNTFAFGDVLQPPSFLSLTPGPVRLPLLSAYDNMEERKGYGLIRLASDVGWPPCDFFPIGPPEQARKGTGGFLLSRIADIPKRTFELSLEQPLVTKLLCDLPGQLENWSRDHWVWIEERGNSLFVWDAQLSPDDWDRPGADLKFLIAFGANCLNGERKWAYGAAKSQGIAAPQATAEKASGELAKEMMIPVPALITSFRPDGLLSAAPVWSNYGVNVDMYCFQREEASVFLRGCCLRRECPSKWLWHDVLGFNLKRLWRSFHKVPAWDWNARPRFHFRRRPRLPFLRPDCSVCNWLSKKSGNRSYIEAAANEIKRHLPSGDFPCVAVTTHLPEISSFNEQVRRRGIRGLRFVLELVNILNDHHKCNIETVEIVCGTVLSHVHWLTSQSRDTEARGKKENIFLVEYDRDAARNIFLDSLKDACSVISRNVLVALELEPGALGLVSDYEDLLKLHEMLNDPIFGDQIGFNCDIAHFVLAGITPTRLLRTRKVLSQE